MLLILHTWSYTAYVISLLVSFTQYCVCEVHLCGYMELQLVHFPQIYSIPLLGHRVCSFCCFWTFELLLIFGGPYPLMLLSAFLPRAPGTDAPLERKAVI